MKWILSPSFFSFFLLSAAGHARKEEGRMPIQKGKKRREEKKRRKKSFTRGIYARAQQREEVERRGPSPLTPPLFP